MFLQSCRDRIWMEWQRQPAKRKADLDDTLLVLQCLKKMLLLALYYLRNFDKDILGCHCIRLPRYYKGLVIRPNLDRY